MLSSFHDKLLEFSTIFMVDNKYLIPAVILSYYLYDPGSLLANITRRKLKLKRVTNVDDGFRILINLLLNQEFRRSLKEAFLEILSKTEVVSELISLARDGAIKPILSGLESLRSEYRDNPHLNYALNEIKRIMKSSEIKQPKFNVSSLRAIITMIHASPRSPATVLGGIGSSLGVQKAGTEIWEIDLGEELISNVEFLVYALDVVEVSEDILTNLLSKSKAVIIVYDKPFVRHYRSLENFLTVFIEYLKKVVCIGFLIDDTEKINVKREILSDLSNTYLFYSDNVKNLIHNCMTCLLKYIKKRKGKSVSTV